MCEAVQHHVVADVDDGRDVRRRDDAHEPGEHPGGPDAAAQGHQHAASIGASGRRTVPARPWYHRRPPCQCASPRIGTRPWCRVLREAARVNGDVEAYVEPDGRGRPAQPHLRRVGPGRRRRGRPPGPPRRRQGRRRLPAAALVASTTPCSTPRCSASGRSRRASTPAWGPARWPPSWSGPRRCSLVVDPEAAPLPTSRACDVVEPRRGRGRGGPGSRRTAGPSWLRTIRWPWSGPAGPPASPRGRSSTTPTWPRWPGAPTC